MLLSAVLLGLMVTAAAAPRSGADALSVARRYLQHIMSLPSACTPQLWLADAAAAAPSLRGVDKATSAYHVVNIGDQQGFVIVSGDDRFVPVLGYVPVGSFQDEHPDGLDYWLSFLSDEMNAALEAGYQGPADETDETAIYSQSIAPLITTKWGQTSPFNNKIPLFATGCVATGMAQVMNYWKYPTHGIGSHTHSYNGTNYSADFGITTYDWANMKDVYGGKYDTKAEVDAVSTLMYHLGIATDMQWTKDNSGTPNMYSAYALIHFFGYNPYLYAEGRDYVSDGAWKALIIQQLSTGHPLCYSGYTGESAGAGHYFVLDGYDADTDQFHFNWGWAGAYDGYFSLSSLTPGGQGQAGALTGSYNYNQQMFVNVQPTPLGEPSAHYDATAVAPSRSTGSKDHVTFVTYHLTNNTVDFSGSIGLAVYDADGTYDRFVPSALTFPGNLLLGNSYQSEFEVPVSLSSLDDGNYIVCLAVLRDDSPDKPWPVRAYYDRYTYYHLTISGSQATFSEVKRDFALDADVPVIVGATEPVLYQNHVASFQVKVRNEGTTAFYDEVGVCIKRSRDSHPQCITIPCRLDAGEEKTLTVSGKILRDSGDYTLCGCYADNGEYTYLSESALDITIGSEAANANAKAKANANANAVYDLTGIRLSDTDEAAGLATGIYIRNGQKIIINK